MPLYPSTFDYLNPTADQKTNMQIVREAAAVYAGVLEDTLPEGPDKTYVFRKLREVAMWANVAITHLPDGTPRK